MPARIPGSPSEALLPAMLLMPGRALQVQAMLHHQPHSLPSAALRQSQVRITPVLYIHSCRGQPQLVTEPVTTMQGPHGCNQGSAKPEAGGRGAGQACAGRLCSGKGWDQRSHPGEDRADAAWLATFLLSISWQVTLGMVDSATSTAALQSCARWLALAYQTCRILCVSRCHATGGSADCTACPAHMSALTQSWDAE